MSKAQELPVDRLATTDEQGGRVYLYPAEVKGPFRRLRRVVYDVLLVIFLALPWLRIGGQPVVLLDIPRRRFSLFGETFWAHDAPILLFVLGGFVLALVLATAVWGRVWCGWACPQTVFIDGVFRRLERWIEGHAFERRRRDEGPWTLDKGARRIVKWAAFVAVSLVIAHTFLAYFVGTDELGRMLRGSPGQYPAAFLVMAVTMGIVLFDFGWFREQFCTIACPYGRFQSVLMDSDSLIVGYDARRGEPRRGTAPAKEEGDCVSCQRCVQVCPTGVDIRRGVQLECIACTACIDACDEVMTRLKRPKGLIRYASTSELAGGKRRKFGPRVALYLGLLLVFISGLTLSIAGREALDTTLVRFVGEPYQVVSDQIINHFKIDLSNQSSASLEVLLAPDAAAVATGFELVTQLNPVSVPAGEARRVDFFVRFPKERLSSGQASLRMKIEARSPSEAAPPFSQEEELRLVGPFY